MWLPWYVIKSKNGGQHAAQRILFNDEFNSGWMTYCGIAFLSSNIFRLDGIWDVKCLKCRIKLGMKINSEFHLRKIERRIRFNHKNG